MGRMLPLRLVFVHHQREPAGAEKEENGRVKAEVEPRMNTNTDGN
jgi:hypothetical protein